MAVKVSVYVATSLDGFIARPDGAIDWLNEAGAGAPEGEDFGFGAFLASVDTLVMGRKTYEQVLSFGAWPYGRKPVIVLSRSPIAFPPDAPDTVRHSSEAPEALLERLAGEGVAHVYVDGGATIQGFLAAGLVDEITVTAIPVLLGEGIRLFGPLAGDVRLVHLRTTAYPNGFVQTTYAVDRRVQEGAGRADRPYS